MGETVATRIASLIVAMDNCKASGNATWLERHGERLQWLVRETMPSGGGFDSGTELDSDKTNAERLTFTTSFHHMDESGSYAGWTDHRVTVRASLLHGLTVDVSGRNRNDIKDYIADAFRNALAEDAPAYPERLMDW